MRTVALAGVASAALLTGRAIGQDGSAPTTAATGASEEVLVTGTRTRSRTVVTTPVPVDVVTQGDLEQAGALGGEFGQALQNLVPSFNMQRQSNSGTADIVRPAQLRGMSPDQVLVLINGKRRHTTSITTTEAKTGRGTAPVDFNSIPSNAIKRVEVLRDGAGAQYGSDAIAGVINVILDDAPDGIEVDASYGFHDTSFEPTQQDITDGETWIVQGSAGIPLGIEGAFVRVGFEYKDRDQTNRAGFDQGSIFDILPDFGGDERNQFVVGRRNFKPGDGATEALNVWLNGAVPVSDGMEVYGFATYSDRDGEGTGFYRYPYGPSGNISVYPEGFRPVTTGKNRDLSLTAGLRSDAGAWVWDVSANYGRNEFEGGVVHTINPSLGPTSPTAFFTGSFENELFTLNADASREFDVGLAAPASLAFGAEYRREAFESHAGDPLSYAAGPFAGPPDFALIGAQAGSGLRPEEERNLDRDVFGVYAELSLDLAENLFVDLAGRYENSSDYDDTLAGKAAVRWEFLPNVALRASVSNSYRAPSLVQIGFVTSSTSFGDGGQLTRVGTLPVDDPLARALGAQDLDAEKALSYSVGLTASIDDEFYFSLDGYQINVDDRITLSERIAGDNPSLPPEISAQFAARNIEGANFFTNAIDTETKGIDVVATYVIDEVWDGTLDLSAAFSYAETEITGVRSIGPVTVIGIEESNTIEGAAPKHRVILTANWSDEVVSGLIRLTYQGETTRIFNFGDGFEPEQTYGGEWQVDVEAGWQVTQNVKLYAGVSNLLDQYPDLSIPDISYFGNFPYDVLSPIGMNGRYLYTGVRANF